MAKIFISYSRKDTKAAQKLIAALEDMGHHVWVDWESILPGSDWLDQIFKGIEGSDAFIFLISPDSIISEVCNIEIGHAGKNNKRIVPVVVKTVKSDETNEIIRKINWTFIRRNDNYKDGLKKIKEAIELDFDWVEEHNRLQNRAIEWDEKKDSSMLLRGRDLREARRAVAKAKNKEPLLTDLQGHYINHSIQGERRRIFVWGISALTVVLMAGLAFFAFDQRDKAKENEVLANQQRQIAEMNAQEANDQRKIAIANEQDANQQKVIAEQQRAIAEDQKLVAQAQRSAARAQIYQTQPGELYTSTLLAIASWQTSPSDEAEEILRKNISQLPLPVKQTVQGGSINSLEFNADRSLFVTGSADGETCVWMVSGGEKIFCVTSPKSVNDAVFSPDGNYIVSGDASGEVQIISVLDGSVQNTDDVGTFIWDIDIGNKRNEIAVTRDDRKITILDLLTGKRKYDLDVSGQIRRASFSPNGNYLAAGSSDGVVNLWNMETNAAPITSGRHKGEVLALVFSPNSRYLVTGGADGYAVVARTSTGQELYRLLHEDAVTDIAFNPLDGLWFATVSNDRRLRLWDIVDGNERIRMSQDNFIEAVDVSANGQWLATTGADRTVRVWNASTGTEMFKIPLAGEGTVLGFGEDGNSLVTGDKTGEINVWDISVMSVAENSLQFNDLVGDVQFSPSGNWLAASDGSRIWLLKPDQLSTLKTHPQDLLNLTVTGNVSSLAFSPDSNWLGISTDAGQVLVYHLVNNSWRTFTSSGAEHEIVFSSDSTYLLVRQPEGSVDEWDLATNEQIVAFAGGLENVTSMAASPSHIALGVDDKIEILGASGERAFEIESPGDHSQLVFSADGSMLASCNTEGFIEIWKLENGASTLIGSIRKEAVHSMSFNPDGTRLAVGTTNTVYLIDPKTVKETARIPQAGTVTGVSYSADGSILATSSLKAVQFWDMTKIQPVKSDNLVDVACSRLKANFSKAQWSNLFGAEEYRVLCKNLPVP